VKRSISQANAQGISAAKCGDFYSGIDVSSPKDKDIMKIVKEDEIEKVKLWISVAATAGFHPPLAHHQ
jgi:hypothetical protein